LDLMAGEYGQAWGAQGRNPENTSVIDANWE